MNLQLCQDWMRTGHLGSTYQRGGRWGGSQRTHMSGILNGLGCLTQGSWVPGELSEGQLNLPGDSAWEITEHTFSHVSCPGSSRSIAAECLDGHRQFRKTHRIRNIALTILRKCNLPPSLTWSNQCPPAVYPPTPYPCSSALSLRGQILHLWGGTEASGLS